MYWKSDESSEYRDTPLTEYSGSSVDADYAHPSYYQPEQQSHSVQPVQSFSPYADSLFEAPPMQLEETPVIAEYTSPASMEGYTGDVGQEQREAAQQETASGTAKKRKGLAGLGGLSAIGALLLKFFGFLASFKWLLFLAKFGFAGFSALVSIWLYAMLFGWPFAIGLVALLFIHEMGHAVVMKLKGIPVGGLIFVPMLGAAVFMKQMPKNARDEAEVGIAGPIAGAIASSVCLLLALHAPERSIWAPLAYFGFFMNLFNLIPIVPFDGGRVLAAIDRRVWVIGFLGLVAFQIWSWLNGNFSMWLLFFVFMAATQFWSRGVIQSRNPLGQAYYDIPVSERVILSIAYFGLAAVLYLGMTMSHGLMASWLTGY